MTRLVLAGGGHAHLSVLELLARNRSAGSTAGIEATLVTPAPFQNYSGMLPGWIAGHYTLAECRIDLRPLAAAAGVRLILDSVTGMDAGRRHLTLAGGITMDYDLLSLDVGSETDTGGFDALGARLLPMKPLDDFFARWPQLLAQAEQTRGYRLVVVGGGAAGVEIALAVRHAFGQAKVDGQVALVASASGLLPGHAAGVVRRAQRYLATAGISLYHARANSDADGIVLDDGTRLPAHAVIAATGARPLGWLCSSGLALDSHGYIAVDARHRSTSHPQVFAAGDTCARQDVRMARSGVHAVHAGPVLAYNLLATTAGKPLRNYAPRPRSLYLLATGPLQAIASWGPWSAEGRWVWRWKDRIDRAFIRRFSPKAATSGV